jgi:hypothetical protein
MGFYAADGSMNVTVVDGSVYTGLYASDGSVNVIKSTGASYVGAYHPCGAWWVTLAPGGATPIRAPDGSLYVDDTGLTVDKNTGRRVTVVSGTLHPSVGTLGSPMGLLLALTYAS